VFDQIREGGLDDRHVIIEQNRKARRNAGHAFGCPHDHCHDAVLITLSGKDEGVSLVHLPAGTSRTLWRRSMSPGL